MLTWKYTWGFYWYRSIPRIEIPRIVPLFYLMFDVGWGGWVGVGVDIYVLMWEQGVCVHVCGDVKSKSCLFLTTLHLSFFWDKQGLSLKPKFITSARLPVSFRIHLLHLSSAFRPAKAELTGTCLARHMNSGDLNSDPHSCTVGTLPKEPFLQLSGQGLLTCGKSIQNDNGGMLFTLSV